MPEETKENPIENTTNTTVDPAQTGQNSATKPPSPLKPVAKLGAGAGAATVAALLICRTNWNNYCFIDRCFCLI